MLKTMIITESHPANPKTSSRGRGRIGALAMCILALGSCGLFAAEAPAPQAEGAKAPNIIFILADDLGWAGAGFNGGSIPTPALDQLAKEGLRFDRHYVAPYCSPTRAGLLTGRYWSRFGITVPSSRQCLPDGTATIASVLKAAGYRTAITGKWHLGGAELPTKRPGLFGFEYSYGCLDGAAHPFTHVYTPGGSGGDDGQGIKTWHRNGEFIEEQGHVTDLITQEAVQWLEQNAQHPFFLYVPYTAPHEKCMETPEWTAKCPNNNYGAMIAHMDDGIGRIVSTLERLHLRQNTLIVFSSDNGGIFPSLNAPLRAQKGTVYEGGVRVAALANWPGRVAPGVLREPICIIDWMPTFCALAGVEAPARLDGRNVWPLLSQPALETEPRPIYLLGSGQNKAALVFGDWKLVRTPAGDELYDLSKDIGEKRNLAGTESTRLESMRELLRKAAQADRDSVAPEISKRK